MPITLFVSDAFGMIGTVHTGKPGWICDYRTQNLEDYYELIQNNPELKDSIKPATYTYINEEAAIAAREFKETISSAFNDANPYCTFIKTRLKSKIIQVKKIRQSIFTKVRTLLMNMQK